MLAVAHAGRAARASAVRDRAVRDQFLDRRQPVRHGGLLRRLSPQVGVVWQAGEDVQVYGNASHAYEPPLLLELTAPGQIQGISSQLEAQKAWQFEVGTRGRAVDARDAGTSPSTTSSCGTRSRTSTSSRSPARRSRSRASGTSTARGTPAWRWALDVVLVERPRPAPRAGSDRDALARGRPTPGRASSSSTTPNFGNNDLPGAPRHFLRAELRYDHASGFWFAPGVEVVPHGYFVNSENTPAPQPTRSSTSGWATTTSPGTSASSSRARNLTDVTYVSSVAGRRRRTGRFFEPGDGRAFYGGVAVEVEVMGPHARCPAVLLLVLARGGGAGARPAPRPLASR